MNDLHERIKRIVIIIAMEIEATPVIKLFGMKETNDFSSDWPMKAYRSENLPNLSIVVNGKCPIHGADRIGTQAAAISAWESINIFKPDLIISAGTAGGFKKYGANIGDIYISSDAIRYHDRRIPFDIFQAFQHGHYQPLEVPHMIEKFSYKQGVVSSGDSLPLNEEDKIRMNENNARAKDMEAAAIAEVAHLRNTNMLAVKVITDFVDETECTFEQFQRNYATAVQHLTQSLDKIVDFIFSHPISEL